VQNDEREENELRARRGEALLPSLERVFTMREWFVFGLAVALVTNEAKSRTHSILQNRKSYDHTTNEETRFRSER